MHGIFQKSVPSSFCLFGICADSSARPVEEGCLVIILNTAMTMYIYICTVTDRLRNLSSKKGISRSRRCSACGPGSGAAV